MNSAKHNYVLDISASASSSSLVSSSSERPSNRAPSPPIGDILTDKSPFLTQEPFPIENPPSHIHPIHASVHGVNNGGKRKVLLHALKATLPWVLGGIAIMLLGISIVQAALLPRIYTCPPDADCPGSFDPITGNILQLVQSLMGYVLQLGLMVASVGIGLLASYQSWFIMMRSGNTSDVIDLKVGAIKGSITDMARLFLRKNNRWLALFLLLQVAIGVVMSLLVGLSIEKTHTVERTVSFNFMGVSTFPNSHLATLNNDGQELAGAKVAGWALTDDRTHNSSLPGTLVIPDSREKYAVRAKPYGPRISGDFVCTPVTNYTFSTANGLTTYAIIVLGRKYLALDTMTLSVSMTSGLGTAYAHYLWVSNTEGVLPNATKTSDGKMFITRCNHTMFMVENDESLQEGEQWLERNTITTSGCDSSDNNVCIADSVNNAILNWWGGAGNAFFHISCRGGVLGVLNRENGTCALTKDAWKGTVTSMLDGIIQTAPRSGPTSQELAASVQSISPTRWWLQGIVPGATLLLYIGALTYTVFVSGGNLVMKKLEISEIITAAQSEPVNQLVRSGRLKKATLLFGGDGRGFTETRDL